VPVTVRNAHGKHVCMSNFFKDYRLTRCSRKRFAEDVSIYPEFGGARKTAQPEVVVGRYPFFIEYLLKEICCSL
jgi:hypothetical protein